MFYKEENKLKLEKIYNKYFSHTKDTKYFLVTGTNGKGSTSYYLQQLIVKSGFDCGLLTSPHVCFVNERIKANENYINSKDIELIVSKYIDIFIKYELSYFEILFFVSLEYFSNNFVKYAVLEIGIGGEFDACNIVNPIASILTNVTFDHQYMLGNTIEEITKTKLGITRKNVKLFVGSNISDKARKTIDNLQKKKEYITIYTRDEKETIKDLNYTDNANFNLAISTAKAILKNDFTKEDLSVTKFNKLPSRMMKINYKNTNILVDGCHNIASLRSLLMNLETNSSYDMFICLKKDKDRDAILKEISNKENIKNVFLLEVNEEWATNWRGMRTDKLEQDKFQIIPYKKLFSHFEGEVRNIPIICGSFYLTGKFLKDISNKKNFTFSKLNVSNFYEKVIKTP